MKDLNAQIDCLKEKTEDTMKFYAEKQNWDPQDIECLEKTAKLYDKLQTIQMNNGIWENMKEGGMSYGGQSMARYPRISYGNEFYGGQSYGNEESYMRGRDANTGRYMSRDDMSYRGGQSYGESYARGGQGGGGGRSQASYNDGRSMHSVKDQAIQRLEQLMDSAQSDYEREQVRGMIAAVEGQKR